MSLYLNDNGAVYQDPTQSTSTDDLSFFGFIKRHSNTDTQIFWNGHSGSYGQGWSLNVNDIPSGGALRIDVAYKASLASSLTITDTSEWHFVGVQRISGTWYIYLDDEVQSVGTTDPYGLDGNSLMLIGGWVNDGSVEYESTAYYAEFGYWESVLTSANRIALRTKVSVPSDITTGLKVYLPFEDGDLGNNTEAYGDFTLGGTTTYNSSEPSRAVGYVASSTGGATSGTAVSTALPTGATTGDVVIVVVHANGPKDSTDNNGSDPYTGILTNREYNGTSAQYDIFYRVLDGSEGATIDFTLSGSDRWCIIASAYRNVDTSTIWDVEPSATTENTATGDGTSETDSITTTTDNAKIISFSCNDSSSVTFTGTPSGFFVRQNNSGEQLLALADKTLQTAGTQASVTWTQSASNGYWINNTFALKPDTGASVADLEVNKSESVTVSESKNAVKESFISESESVSVAESVGKLVTSFINKTESVTTGESASVVLPDALEISKSESVTVEEAVALSTAFEINVSDGVTVEESNTTTLPDALTITESESVTVEEATTTTVISLILALEEITTSESSGSDISMTINVSDDISVAEEPSESVSTPEVSVTEETTIGESVGLEVVAIGTVETSDSVTVGESVSVSVDIDLVSVDVVLVEEGIATAGDLGDIDVSDSVTAGEAVYTIKAYNISAEDAVSVSDDPTVLRGLTTPSIMKSIKQVKPVLKASRSSSILSLRKK